ncbi:cytochrome P450 [Amycolatopsis sp. FDAARGOS 1241]|uniref:cytochrome P450 n=1 Tax=Amycolatopsis sp. FDAARGOS 1241 TaxID=2778070 RepID=UPI00351C1C32
MLSRDGSLAEAAVEEVLRYDSPIQLTLRTALVDTVVGGVELTAGTQTVVLIGAANRDPRAFRDPGVFDLAAERGTCRSGTVRTSASARRWRGWKGGRCCVNSPGACPG